MTLEEFFTEIERFGGGDTIEDRTVIISSANRALREIYLSIPVTKSIRYNVNGHKPVTYIKKMVCKAGESLVLPLKGKAYSMRVVGFGNYTIDMGTSYITQFNSGNDSLFVRGFITQEGTIEFWGSFSIVIYDFSIFDDIFSPELDDIPDGSPINTHDIKAVCSDFLAFVSHPTDRYGNLLENCRLREGNLEIDSSYSGEIILTYRRLPTLIYGVDPGNDYREVVDISDEHIPALLYLTWYYYWYNIDEAKAKIYRNRYECMLELAMQNYRYIDRKYIDVNGWA